MEWLQVFTIVAALVGIVGVQTTWILHALQRIEARLDRFEARMDDRLARIDDRFTRLEQDVIRDHGERISRLEARLE